MLTERLAGGREGADIKLFSLSSKGSDVTVDWDSGVSEPEDRLAPRIDFNELLEVKASEHEAGEFKSRSDPRTSGEDFEHFSG